MAFDGAFMSLVLNELKPAIGARIDKIYQPTRDSFVFFLRSRDFNGKLLISANSASARFQLTESSPENPANPPMLCMLIRKKLVGARLANIRQNGLERIAWLDFDTQNEFGDPVTVSIISEIMGRNSNIIIIDGNNRVIDSVRRTDATDDIRIIMPGTPYILPPAQDKIDFLDCTDKIIVKIKQKKDFELSRAIQLTVSGISPVVCREIAFTVSSTSINIEDMEERHFERLRIIFDRFKKMLTDKSGLPTMIIDRNGKPFDYTFTDVHQYSSLAITREYSTYSELLDAYFTEREKKERMAARSQDILKRITNIYSRISRRIAAQTGELESARNCESLRIFGELVKANIHSIPKGSSSFEAVNYYSENCETVKIKLDPALSPAENAQKYFKNYRKKHTAARVLEDFILKGQKELEYIDSVLDELSRAETASDLAEIKTELIMQGYIKEKRDNKHRQRPVKATEPMKFISDDGFLIMVGKNNRQNDILTLKTAKSHDLWLHVKENAGSHVIIVSNDLEIPDSTIEQAAVLAAVYSKACDAPTVPVNFCPVKRVKKPPASAPGMVIFENYKTAYVAPDKNLPQKLVKNIDK